MKKILLLITEAGGGHKKVAESIKSYSGNKYDFEIVNVYKQILNSNVESVYNKIVLGKWLTYLYWLFFVPVFKIQLKLKYYIYFNKFTKYWKKQNHPPDLVISLIPFLNRLIYSSLKKYNKKIPFWICMTDIANPPGDKNYWFYHADRLLVPSIQALKEAENSRFIFEKIINLSGIIIGENFLNNNMRSKDEKRKNKIIISYGKHSNKKRVQNILTTIHQAFSNYEVIVLCGLNEALKRSIEEKKYQKIKAVGFTSDIVKYFTSSDIFIGKPGPTTVSEALQLGLFVLCDTKRIMKHERPTVDFLKKTNLGVTFHTEKELITIIKNLKPDKKTTQLYHNSALLDFAENLDELLTDMG